MLPVTAGEQGYHRPINVVTEKNARDVKREIQENSDEPIGYLKLTDERSVENGRRYMNAQYLMSAHPAKVRRQVDGKEITVDGTFVAIDHYYGGSPYEAGRYIDMPPFESPAKSAAFKALDQTRNFAAPPRPQQRKKPSKTWLRSQRTGTTPKA